jgi:endonuclease/exonuclease/phosphatase family metal-dependent hydrolase
MKCGRIETLCQGKQTSVLLRSQVQKSWVFIVVLCLWLNCGSVSGQVPKIGTDTTLDIGTWNIEWFGDSLNGPSNEVTQLKNVTEVIQGMNLDLLGLCEISNAGYWAKLQSNLPDYGAVLTNYSQTQKTGLLYRKSMFRLLYSKSILLAFDYEFASGRFPLEVALETQWGSKKDTMYIWVMHLKANTGSTSEKLTSYNRRAKAAEELKNYLDPKKRWKGVVLGDWNDDLDVSIVSGKASPFVDWRNDTNYVFPSYRLSLAKQKSTASYSEMIDHMCVTTSMKSNWLLNQSGVMVGDAYVPSYRFNTSDHYPVWARFSMEWKPWVGVELLLEKGSGNSLQPIWLEVLDLQGRLLFQGDPAVVYPKETGMYLLRYGYSNGQTKSVKVFVR